MFSVKGSLCSILLLASQAAAVAQWSGTQAAGNLTVEYCSKENTGVSNDQGSNIYQTLGLCNDKCVGKFAYAVLQYQECWCSNEKPGAHVSVESCDQSCPGYPDQKCGSKDAGLFSYVPLGEGSASGGVATSTSASTSSASSASNSTKPAATPSFSAASNSSSATENGNSTSSSDASVESSTGDAAGLSVSRTALAVSAIVIGCAFGLTA